MFAVTPSPSLMAARIDSSLINSTEDADSNATKRFLLASAVNEVENYVKGWGGRPQRDFKLLAIPRQLRTQGQ